MQVHLDPFWTILRYYGHAAEPSPLPFYEAAVPRLLDLLARHGVPATFFVIGADIRAGAGRWAREIAAAGHEVANHSEDHILALTRLPADAIEREIARAEDAIAAELGARPVGFASPGYDVDERLVATLERRGYLYDSSLFPSVYQLAVRLAQALMRLRRPSRHGTMGRLALIAAPHAPFRPSRDDLRRADPSRAIVELPIATLPLARLPFHGTSVLAFGTAYREYALRSLRDEDTIFTFHGLDVIGSDTDAVDPRIRGLVGLALPLSTKIGHLDRVLAQLRERFAFVTSAELARSHGPGPSGDRSVAC